MEFEERVERFFKQFKTCLGIEPDLRASFLDNTETKLAERPGTFKEMIRSPRLPFDLTSDDIAIWEKIWRSLTAIGLRWVRTILPLMASGGIYLKLLARMPY